MAAIPELAVKTGFTAGYSRQSASRQPMDLVQLTFGHDLLESAGQAIHVCLKVLGGDGATESMSGSGPVREHRDGPLRVRQDSCFEFGSYSIREIGENPAAIEQAAAAAYRAIGAWRAAHGYPTLARVWNYLDAITVGDGDEERYRRFCVGRGRSFEQLGLREQFPAATAIGRCGAPRADSGHDPLQVLWLATKLPGRPIENPRQLPAFQYPREYGPRSPSFARAFVVDPAGQQPLLFISGTASVVGHASRHPDDVGAQLDETMVNLDALLATARLEAPALPATFGADSLLKVYVRDPRAASMIETRLRNRWPTTPLLLLHGEICRRELLLEIDGLHC